MNIDEAQKALAKIYPNKDISLHFMIDRIVANAGIIATNHKEGVVKNDPFVEIVSWCMAIFTKAKKSFWQEIILRYPNACYKCLAPVCICHSNGGSPRSIPVWQVPEERKNRGQTIIDGIRLGEDAGRARVIPYISEPPTLDQVSEMFSRIYSRNDIQFQYSPDSFFPDIVRCIGRLSNEISKNNADATRVQLTEYVLSTFAWFLEFWRLSSKKGLNFSPTTAFAKRYSLGCPICGRTPCNCGDNRFNRLMTFDLVIADSRTNDPRAEFRAQLNALNELLTAENIDALPEAVAEKEKATVLTELTKKRQALEEIDKSTEAIGSIGKRIAALTAWVSENLLS
jgi:hypothetical protein